MNDKCFFDTNVIVYAYNEASAKHQKISRYLISDKYAVISTQVLQEAGNVFRKKINANYKQIKIILQECINNCTELYINNEKTIMSACDISEKYKYSFYDSLIIASALESGCNILYSEDMQNKQIIENKLTIINPFC
jgi:predicted nucleic acid-binding protein